jgi:hypothetical protein
VDASLVTNATGVFNSTTVRDIALPVNATIDQLDSIPLSQVQGFKALALPWYTDQILPFDVTIACANEYGAAASSKIFGIEILNEGFGTSIDDSVMEAQATFVARTVSPLQAVGRLLDRTLSGLLPQIPGDGRGPKKKSSSRVASSLILDGFCKESLLPGGAQRQRN